ncbi:unnamed protein product [Cunninghamella echinulata]
MTEREILILGTLIDEKKSMKLEKQQKLEHYSEALIYYYTDVNIENQDNNNGNRYIFINEKILVMALVLSHLKELYYTLIIITIQPTQPSVGLMNMQLIPVIPHTLHLN